MTQQTGSAKGVLPIFVAGLLVSSSAALLIPKPPCFSAALILHHHTVQRRHVTQPSQATAPIVSPRDASARRCRTTCFARESVVHQGGTSGIRYDVDGSATRTEALSLFFAGILSTAAVLADKSRATAADTNTGTDGLGVVDDLLADCPSTPTCVSSQDDRPYPFMEPWAYDGPWERAMSRLRAYVEFNDGKIIASSSRYLRVEFDAANALPPSVDDAEFYFTPGDALVQFRCARRNGPTDFGSNRRRMNNIRIALKFESIPVLRNRRRTFFFGESPLDSFGPSFGKVDPSVIYGDMDPMSPPFETPSDVLRERYGGEGGGAHRPAWWGKPIAEAGGFADWLQTRLVSC